MSKSQTRVLYLQKRTKTKRLAPLTFYLTKWFLLIFAFSTLTGLINAQSINSPLEVNNLIGWFDASDSSTITATSGVVSEWRDKSGSNNHVAQATEIYRPKTGTRQINSINVIEFEGANSIGRSSLGNGPAGNLSTVFTIGSRDNIKNEETDYFHDLGQYSHQNYIYQSKYELFSSTSLNGGTPDTSSVLACSIFNGATSILRINGNEVLYGNTGSKSFDRITIGARYDGNAKLDGVIGEMIIFNRVLTASEVSQIESYLATKWGIPIAGLQPQEYDFLIDHTLTSIGGAPGSSTAVEGSSLRLLSGAGSIYSTSDVAAFASVPISGDFDFVARVAGITSSTTSSIAGIMVRDSLSPTAKSSTAYFRNINGGRVYLERRSTDGADSTTLSGTSNLGTSLWLKVTRRSQTLRSYYSTDGSTWLGIGSDIIPMGALVEAGLVATTNTTSGTLDAVFDNIAITDLEDIPSETPVSGFTSDALHSTINTANTNSTATIDGGSVYFDTQNGDIGFGTSPDNLSFAHVNISGDFDLIGRVAEFPIGSSSSRAGLMVRDSLNPLGPRFAAYSRKDGRRYGQSRADFGGTDLNINSSGYTTPIYFKISRRGSAFYAYHSYDGTTWSYYYGKLISMSASVYVGAFHTSGNSSTVAEASIDNLSIVPISPTVAAPPEEGFVSNLLLSAIGSTQTGAESSVDGGSVKIVSLGGDLGGAADNLTFASVNATGNFVLTARVTGFGDSDGSARAGLMARSSLSTDSKAVSAYMRKDNRRYYFYRGTDGASSVSGNSSGISLPRFLKMERRDNFFILSHSADGLTWTPYYSCSVDLGQNAEVGLFLTGFDANKIGSAAFDQISLIDLPELPPSQPGVFGQILWQKYDGAFGDVAALKASSVFPNQPTHTMRLSSFEGPSDIADNYGSRISGWIKAPASGNYEFWVASDGASELWLSASDDPASKVLIAAVTGSGYTSPRQWTKYASQKSAAIALEGNKAYFIEAIHREGTANDNLAVAWSGPGIAGPVVIGGQYLTSELPPLNTNNPPVLAQAIPEQPAIPGQSFSFTIPTETFTDADTNDTLVWTISAPASWITTVDNGTRTITGTPQLADTGLHTVVVSVADSSGGTASTDFDIAVGGLTYQFWTGINSLSGLKADSRFPDDPNITSSVFSFEGPTDIDEYYGSRIFGWLVPPTTGQYQFWIASDDESELWLSTDSNPVNRLKIASVNGWTTSRQWTKYSTQTSGLISLEANKIYYIEAIHREGWGGDNLAVAWSGPGISGPTVIEGQFLNGIAPAANTPPSVSQAIPNQSAIASQPFSYTIPNSAFTDPDDHTLTWSIATSAAWLASINNSTRTISGTPASGDVGQAATIVVTVTDSAGNSANTSFNVVVAATANQTPVAGPLPSLVGVEDQVILIPVTASDSEDGAISINASNFAIASSPAHGAVTINGSEVTYTPGANRHGAVSFSYKVKDSGGNWSAPAVVTVNLVAVADPVLAASLYSLGGSIDPFADPLGVEFPLEVYSAALVWQEPAGGSDIVSYRVELRDSQGSVIRGPYSLQVSDGRAYAFDGLRSNQTYTATIVSITSGGSEAASAPISGSTLSTLNDYSMEELFNTSPVGDESDETPALFNIATGSFELASAGSGISLPNFGYRYGWAFAAGDFDLSAAVVAQYSASGGEAGLLAKLSSGEEGGEHRFNKAESPFAGVLVKADGSIRLAVGNIAGGVAAQPVVGTVTRLRMARTGSTLSGYYETDLAPGLWTLLGSVEMLPDPSNPFVAVGLAATSSSLSERALAIFSSVSFRAELLGYGFDGMPPASPGHVIERGLSFADTDRDGIPDYWERRFGLDAGLAADAAADGDGDGLTNLAEYQVGGNPLQAAVLNAAQSDQIIISAPNGGYRIVNTGDMTSR